MTKRPFEGNYAAPLCSHSAAPGARSGRLSTEVPLDRGADGRAYGFVPEYSLKIPRVTVRFTSTNPTRVMAARIVSGGTQFAVVSQ